MAEARAVAIDAQVPRLLLLFSMAASLLWKLQALALPPHGEHAWRDRRPGVARSFLHESWNLLLPRAAERGPLLARRVALALSIEEQASFRAAMSRADCLSRASR